MSDINALLEQLHDIEGLDSVSVWPLAIGWWIVIALGVVLVSLAVWFLIRWLLFRMSWKYDTLKKLNHLLGILSSSSISDEEMQNAVVLFSEYLRRIALRRFSRKECAGLKGQAWLEWLSKRDVKNFDWVNAGKLLIHAPYAPKSRQLTPEQLKRLIQAAKEWVR